MVPSVPRVKGSIFSRGDWRCVPCQLLLSTGTQSSKEGCAPTACLVNLLTLAGAEEAVDKSNLIPTPILKFSQMYDLFLPFILVRRRRWKYIKSMFGGRGQPPHKEGRVSLLRF